MRESLSIRENLLGPQHPHVAVSLKEYAKLLRKMKRKSDAPAMERRAATILGFRSQPR